VPLHLSVAIKTVPSAEEATAYQPPVGTLAAVHVAPESCET
jgi:hypothetical protein